MKQDIEKVFDPERNKLFQPDKEAASVPKRCAGCSMAQMGKQSAESPHS